MSDIRLRTRRWRFRPILMVPLGSLMVLVLGWSALWVVARQQTLSAMAGWFATEAAHGRHWTCPHQQVAGYPLRVILSCREPTFAGIVDGAAAEGRLEGFRAEAWLYEPTSVDAVVRGPLAFTSQNEKANFTLSWADLHVTLRGLAGVMGRVAIDIEQPDLALPNGDGGSAEHAELHVGPAAGRAADDVADAVEFLVSGASVPALDAATGDAVPLDAEMKGVVTRAFGDLPDFGPATVERWRQHGGTVEISRLVVNKGDLKAQGTGTMGLDEVHRLSGRLQASLSGFGPLAERLGIPIQAVAVGSLLAKLMNGSPLKTSTESGGTGTVTLPITLANGSLSVGPARTGVRLPPLY